MTWCSENSAAPDFLLASSAIHCRFVDRFVGRRVPSRVSRQWLSCVAPPFPPMGPGEPGSPPSSVLRWRYDFPPAHPRSLMCSLPGSTCSSDVRVRRSAPGAAEDCRRAWDSCSAGVPSPACLHVGACGTSQVPWRSVMHLCPALKTPAEPTRPRHLTALSMLPPVPTLRRLQRHL